MSISYLRQIITELVTNNEIVSGIEIMSKYDWKCHAIPTLNQFRHAIKNIDDLNITKDEKDILLFTNQTNFDICITELKDDDIKTIYEAYIKGINRK